MHASNDVWPNEMARFSVLLAHGAATMSANAINQHPDPRAVEQGVWEPRDEMVKLDRQDLGADRACRPVEPTVLVNCKV